MSAQRSHFFPLLMVQTLKQCDFPNLEYIMRARKCMCTSFAWYYASQFLSQPTAAHLNERLKFMMDVFITSPNGFALYALISQAISFSLSLFRENGFSPLVSESSAARIYAVAFIANQNSDIVIAQHSSCYMYATTIIVIVITSFCKHSVHFNRSTLRNLRKVCFFSSPKN